VLFAEDGLTSPSPNVLTFVMGQLGVVGALVWYLWYQTAKEMPSARRDFLASLQEQAAEHTKRLNPFMQEMRDLHGEMHSMIMAQQDLADAIREAVDVRRMPRPSRADASPHAPDTGRSPRTPAEPG
jgi:hypothetical protein